MPKILPSPLRGVLSLLLYVLNTVFWAIPLLLFALLKLLLPVAGWQRVCAAILNGIATSWIAVNNFNQTLLCDIRWDVDGTAALQKRGWYLVLANHQSWVDILVLQNIFHRRIPFLKFFLKKELFWVPILGLCWWALDFPFMKRYSKSFLKKKPHLKGKDFETTARACQKFKHLPVSIMNFVEGTRFTREKHATQGSPYTHLLKTRAGGIAFVMGAMGEQLDRILDVTIVYPQGIKSFWAFLCGEVNEIKVRIDAIAITEDLRGNYAADRHFRAHFHNWLNQLWAEKDRRIRGLLSDTPSA